MKGKRVIASLFALFIFLFHLTFTILYNAPINPMTSTYIEAVRAYMNPIFSQKWLLFAPEPPTLNIHTWYRCRFEAAGWGNWKDPASQLLRAHKYMPATFKGKLYQVYYKMSLGLNNAYVKTARMSPNNEDKQSLDNFIQKKIKTNKNYLSAKKMITDVCQSEIAVGDELTGLQFQLAKTYVKPYSKRFSKKDLQKLKQ